MTAIRPGGGEQAEGEDIEVIELPLADALAMVCRGATQDGKDGKTIMLLQHAALVGLDGLAVPGA